MLRSHRWRTADNSAAYLLPYLREGSTCWMWAAVQGSLTIDLAKRTAPGRVVGVDLSARSLPKPGEAAETAGVPNVSFLAGDFRSVGFQPATFDVVHAHQVLQHLRDPVGALAAMRGLVRDGGHRGRRESDYSGMIWSPASPAPRPMARDLPGGHPPKRRRGQCRALAAGLGAAAAGFRDITYTSSTWTFATEETRRWWAELWAERTVASSFAEQAVAYGMATATELAEVSAGWREWAAIRLPCSSSPTARSSPDADPQLRR